MEQIILNALCVLLSIIGLAVAAWVVISGQIQKTGLDALFLVIVCLLAVVIFLPTPIQAIRKGLLGDLQKGKAKPPGAAEAKAQPAVASQKTEQSG